MLDHALLPTLPQMVQVNYSQQAEIVGHLIDQAALTPEARAQIMNNWDRTDETGSPYKDLQRWKDSVFKFIKEHRLAKRQRQTQDMDYGKTTAKIIQVYRACKARPDPSQPMQCAKH